MGVSVNEMTYVARHDFSIRIFEYENEARLIATTVPTDEQKLSSQRSRGAKVQNGLSDQLSDSTSCKSHIVHTSNNPTIALARKVVT